MVSSKEYNMLFKLSAQLNGAFTSTFKTAGTSVQSVQEQIKALAQQQADISAYTKQQTAVDNTKRKLEDLQKQYDNIQKEYTETGESSSDLANKMIDKQRQIDKTSASLETQTQKLDGLEAELKEAGVDTENLDEESKKLEKEMDELGEEMEETSDEGVSGFEALGEALVAAGVVEGMKQLAEAYKECVELSSTFEAAMSQVAATMGVSSDEVSELSEFAKEMGATTAFTATEAAEGLNILAMAGLDAEQQMAALPTVLNLASAGAMDMASAASYVAGAVKGYGDSMDNAQYYADLMAKGATLSNTNVAQLGEALGAAAATANTYGQSADSLTLSLLRLAEGNKTGSEAATMLMRAMADVYTPTDDASAAMEKLGISAYDAQGNARDFTDVVADLKEAFSGMSQEEANAEKNAIFTTNGLKAFNLMASTSTETLQKFQSGLASATGSTAEQAATQLDNLKGAMTLLDSATDGLKTTIGEEFQPVFTKLINLTSQIVSGVNDWAVKNPVLVKSIIALTAELGVALTLYTTITAAKKIWTKVSELETVAKIAETVAQKGFNTALLECPITWIAAGIAAVTVGVIALTQAVENNKDETYELSEASLEEYNALQDKKAEYQEAAELYGENSEQAQLLAWQVDQLTASYEANKQTLEEEATAHQELVDSLDQTYDSVEDSLNEVEKNSTQTLALVHRLETLASQTTKTAAAQEEMKAIIAELNEECPELALNYEDIADGTAALGNVEAIVKAQAATERYNTAQQAAVDAYKAKQDAEDSLRSSLAKETAATREQSAAWEEYQKKYGDAEGLGSLTSLLSDEYQAYQAATDRVKEYSAEVATDREEVEKQTSAYNDARDALTGYTGGMEGADEAEQQMNSIISTTTSQITELVEGYEKAQSAAYESIHGQYEIWDEAADVSAVSTATVTQNLADQTTYWANYNANIEKLTAQAANIDGLSEAIASFADGSEESVNAIAGMAEATPAQLQSMVTQYQKLQEQQKTTSESLADLTTNFSNEMTTLTDDFKKQISELELSDEAYKNGVTTIQGFIDGANSEYSPVTTAFANLGNSAASALQTALNNHDYSVSVTAKVNVTDTTNAYASGTDYAAAGLALVGEEGPELVMMHGGEKVLTADRTAQIMSGTGNTINLAPSITINGVSDTTAQNTADTIMDLVYSALEQIQTENSRRAYS